jgi:hypothetical protein
MEDKNYISNVKLPSSEILYYLKDLDARELLKQLFDGEMIIDCGTAAEHIIEE